VGLLHGQAMYDSLVEVGVPTQLVIVQNGGHDLKAPDGSPTTPTMEEISQTMLDFLEKYLK
jgi:dipeptidyl aminopeptidase/acylaminoacyl peptidase